MTAKTDWVDGDTVTATLLNAIGVAANTAGSSDVVADTTPQLGGDLDLNSHTVGAATAADLTKLHAVTADATELSYVDGVTSSIQTQLNAKQSLAPAVGTTASSATPSINTDSVSCYSITALATAITSMTSGLSGTPVNFQRLLIRIKDNGTARAITWGASFQSGSVALPTTTVLGKTLLVGLIYDSVDSKWTCEASGSRA